MKNDSELSIPNPQFLIFNANIPPQNITSLPIIVPTSVGIGVLKFKHPAPSNYILPCYSPFLRDWGFFASYYSPDFSRDWGSSTLSIQISQSK